MKLPDNCYMPDISDLAEHPLIPALALSLMFSKGDQFSEKAALYLRNFIRLIDKSVKEYLEAREAILLQIKETNQSSEEMQKKGRVLYILRFVDHAENCVNAIRRLLHLLEFMKKERMSPSIPKIPRKLIEAHGNIIRKIRNTVEHLDEKIQKDEHGEGEPVMLFLAEDEKSMVIGKLNLRFCDLESVIRNFYNIGKYLALCYRK